MRSCAGKQHVAFVGMLVAALCAPLVFGGVMLLLPESAAVGGVVGVTLFALVLLSPFPFLYLAARAAVVARMPGVAVILAWWAVSLFGAVALNWGTLAPDAILRAATFGIVAASDIGVWPAPQPLITLGVSDHFHLELPVYLLFLMAAFTAIKSHQARLARAVEHAGTYAPWDADGERTTAARD